MPVPFSQGWIHIESPYFRLSIPVSPGISCLSVTACPGGICWPTGPRLVSHHAGNASTGMASVPGGVGMPRINPAPDTGSGVARAVPGLRPQWSAGVTGRQQASSRYSQALCRDTAGWLMRHRRKAGPTDGKALPYCPSVSCARGATEFWSSRNIDLVYTWINERYFLLSSYARYTGETRSPRER
jgi:hypothetical protein